MTRLRRQGKRKGRKRITEARIIDWVFEKGSSKQLEELGKWFKRPELLATLASWKKRKFGKPSGVYILYRRPKEKGRKKRRREVYYVGKASRLAQRVKAHLKDEHRGRWEEFAAYGTGRREAETLETLLIKVADPEGTEWKKKKSFSGALDLRREIRAHYRRKGEEFR